MKYVSKYVLFSIVVCGAVLLAADKKPDFSGSWKLDVAKSDLAGSAIEALTVDVDHKDPIFKYTARGSASGRDFEETETFTTDEKPSRDAQGAIVTAHWNGTTLFSQGKDANGQILYTSTLALSDNGKVITRIFTPKGPDGQQMRREIYEKQ